MTEKQMMKRAGDVSYELGCAVAVKQAADRAMQIGRPDAAEHLINCLSPGHKTLLQCMTEVSGTADTGHKAASGYRTEVGHRN